MHKYKGWKKWILSIACMCIFTGCNPKSGGVLIQKEAGDYTEKSREASKEEEENYANIGIYICGEVRKPGVYELMPGSRVTDAIDAAGGVTGKASLNSINLAEYIEDGQKITIPSKAEEKKKEEQQKATGQGMVNINEADIADFMTLPGIGESKANDIIAYRQEHGDFGTITDIMNVPGIKDGIFNRIKDKIMT